ncbi:tetratricopeptide repeat protein [Chryseobacterium sp. BIGb0232]|uniref:tetratricopeptide repeat protein n=1 Tax=Chryseobacterium sp. BIGb0232 TaxID=2940598 RepID=UPI00161C3A67|nr:tetratricopeptide repeat protein [Chryseobacterium sp. BIGb0232]MCS4300770.1 tetratricopeptide (TPR) repeat protein [Chryseobacterium sp. BIGb0232]
MNKYFFIFIFIFLFSIPISACLNGEEMVLSNRGILYTDYEGEVPHGHEFGGKKRLEAFLVTLEKGYNKTKNLDYLSDKGFVLIILGRYKEAIALYKKIEYIEPGRYSTASNIGTAYELSGNNTEALQWIEKALQINPKSHSSSEWIHVNILKAKIKGEEYISSKNLIGRDFGNEKLPQSNLRKNELQDLKMQLYYQLNERISFVKPKDRIVAQLLFDLGNIALLMNQKAEAKEDYQLAEEYGFNNSVLDERIKLLTLKNSESIRTIVNEIKYHTREPQVFHLMETIVSVAAFLLAGFIIFVFRNKIALMLK